MAHRFQSPNEQFVNSAGKPYSGGSLTFYQSGTSTKQDTYSNSGRSITNDNPLELDSAGRGGDIFLADAAYKVVLKDADGVEIWTADPVYPAGYANAARFTSGDGDPNGSVAGTAGSASVLADVYWDYTNSVLYVCTTTGDSASAVWTAINEAEAASPTGLPSGRLTLTSQTPNISSSVTAGTAVYYTPFIGDTIPLYSGSAFVNVQYAELTLTLHSSHAINTLYDVFVFNNSGVPTIVTGPAWQTNTAGSGARGTGSSTSQLTRLNGVLTNAVSMSARNGAATHTVAANRGTYVGTILIDGTAGQCSCQVDYGTARRWGVWNAYNRLPIILLAGDATASWTYSTATWRQSNNSTSNKLTLLCGLAEEPVSISYNQKVSNQGTSDTALPSLIGIGVKSTTSPSGLAGSSGGTIAAGLGTYAQGTETAIAAHIVVPFIGINDINLLEKGGGGTTTSTFYGANTNMQMIAHWRG